MGCADNVVVPELVEEALGPEVMERVVSVFVVFLNRGVIGESGSLAAVENAGPGATCDGNATRKGASDA